MNNEPKEKISFADLLLSFSFLGVIALIGIVIWQRGESLHYLSTLLSLEKPLIHPLIGIILGIGMTTIVVLLLSLSIVFSYVFIWTGSLWVAIVGHSMYNLSVSCLTLRGYLEFHEMD